MSRGDVVLRHFCGRLVLGAFCWRWVLRALGGRPRSFRERVLRRRRGLRLVEGFARCRWHGLRPGRGRLLHRHGLPGLRREPDLAALKGYWDAVAARTFRLLGLHAGPDITVPAAASLAALGFRAECSLADGLSEYVQWLMQQGPIPDYFSSAERELLANGVVRAVENPS